MSEIKSQFFNGKTYSATDFVESNKNTMKDGILPNTDFFKVLPASNMTIGVTSGRGWVQGHAFSSDGTLSFTLDNADGVLDRIDTVIIRLGLMTDNEKIECRVIKGVLGGSATAAVRDGTYYDLVIAQIVVAHGTTAITAAMITDKRGDGNLCGWSGAISGDQFNFNVKADKTYCDDTFTTKAALTTYQLTITNGTTKTNADRLQNKAISATAPTTGQVMGYNGTQWQPTSLETATLIFSGSNTNGGNFSISANNYTKILVCIDGYSGYFHDNNNNTLNCFLFELYFTVPTNIITYNTYYFKRQAILTSLNSGGSTTSISFDNNIKATSISLGWPASNIKVWGIN